MKRSLYLPLLPDDAQGIIFGPNLLPLPRRNYMLAMPSRHCAVTVASPIARAIHETGMVMAIRHVTGHRAGDDACWRSAPNDFESPESPISRKTRSE